MKNFIYDPQPNDEERATVNEIAAAVGILPETAEIIFSRGCRTAADFERFLHPGKKNFHDPFLLKGMRELVDRLTAARDNGETVLVYGDYDADGVSACAIMHYALRKFGVNAVCAVPERADGYGLNEKILADYAEEYFYDLVVTVDCGIGNRDEAEFVKNELGADIIVTDHHEIPDVLPDTVIINPKLKDNAYPFDGLCGAGVALKVAYALLGGAADEFLDFAALATVADSMPLTGENRDIVAEGLKIFNSNKLRPAFRELLSAAGAKTVGAGTLAYALAPRVNAAGRMGDAASALKLFLSEDAEEIGRLAALLSSYNVERQNECDELYREAKAQLAAAGAYRNSIMLVGEKWRAGFVGIVAARLAEEFSRPVVMFAGDGDHLKGSARSVDGVNIFEAISACKNYLIGFGGHAQAAGAAVLRENFEAFYAAMDEFLGERYAAEAFKPKVYAEREVSEKFSMRFAEELNLLEPCGVGNRRPAFVTEIRAANAAPLKTLSPHVSFSTPVMEMMMFGGAEKLPLLNLPVKKKIVFEPEVSVFNGRKYLKGYVRDCVPVYEASDELADYIFERQLMSLADGEISFSEADDDTLAAAYGTKYGTAFVFSDPANVAAFPELAALPVGMFEPPDTSLASAVLIAPARTDGFDTVIYMDSPPRATRGGRRTFVRKKPSGRGLFGGLSVERKTFAEIFLRLKKLTGRKFTTAVDFYRANRPDCNLRQFVFCTRVFIELGIFKVDDGIFRFDAAVRSDLALSALYARTEEILKNV